MIGGTPWLGRRQFSAQLVEQCQGFARRCAHIQLAAVQVGAQFAEVTEIDDEHAVCMLPVITVTGWDGMAVKCRNQRYINRYTMSEQDRKMQTTVLPFSHVILGNSMHKL